jgi:hypothetical protein
VSGFAKTGIFPLYPKVYTEKDFISGEKPPLWNCMEMWAPIRTIQKMTLDPIMKRMKPGQIQETLTAAEGPSLPVTSVHVWLADSGGIRAETIFRNRYE